MTEDSSAVVCFCVQQRYAFCYMYTCLGKNYTVRLVCVVCCIVFVLVFNEIVLNNNAYIE